MRFGWMCFLLLAVFVGVILRLGWLQIIRADDLRKQSENQLTADLTQKHPRGRIVDRDGEELAVSIMTGSLYVDPEGMSDDSLVSKTQPRRDARLIFFEKNHFFCYFFLVLFAYIKTKHYLCIRKSNESLTNKNKELWQQKLTQQ